MNTQTDAAFLHASVATPPDYRQFESGIKPHLSHLRALALRLTRNPSDSQDLLQDLLLKLYLNPRALQAAEHPRSWLSRALYYQFIDTLRRRRTEPSCAESPYCPWPAADEPRSAAGGLLDNLPDTASTPEQTVAQHQLEDVVEELLATLPPLQQRVFRGYYLEERSLPLISMELGVPINTLKSWISRGRSRLRRRLRSRQAPTGSDRILRQILRRRS